MKLKIKITQEILEASKFCMNETYSASVSRIGQNCAIGKAIYALFGDKSWVFNDKIAIFPNGFTFKPNFFYPKTDIVEGEHIDIKLSFDITFFIEKFDKLSPKERVKIKPFEFEIDVPNEVVDLIGINQVYKVLSENTHTLEPVL